MSMVRLSAALAALAAALILPGCAETLSVTSNEPADHPYDGPLYVSRSAAVHPKAGAAGNVVHCNSWGSGGFDDVDVYGEGATADSPDQALEVAHGEGGFGGVQEGLQVARREADRVLYVVEVGGAVKQAVIVHNGPATEGAGGAGWYVESWAHCDYSELPRDFTDSIGLQIWTDAAGVPRSTRDIASWRGPEHCDWQSMTFLNLGESTYVRDPLPEVSDFFAEPYVEHARLTSNAVDTGYQREGEHLWLSPDEQRAFVGTEDDVEVWPRTVKPLGCV